MSNARVEAVHAPVPFPWSMEAWIYARLRKTRLGWLWMAMLRHPFYELLDRHRGWD